MACHFPLYTSVDDWGTITPSNQNGATMGSTTGIGGCISGQNYTTGCLYNYPAAPNINGYYYYIIDVSNARNDDNSGFFARSKSGHYFSLISTIFGRWSWWPNGWSSYGWSH